jgi:hypothetical protein
MEQPEQTAALVLSLIDSFKSAQPA